MVDRRRNSIVIRVLIISADPVGDRMSGPAIRAYETARVLSRSFRVTLLAPGLGSPPGGVRRGGLGWGRLIHELRRSDAVITQGVDLSATWPLFLLFPDKPAVWDLSSPVTLENLARIGGENRGTRFHQRLFLLGLERGDFFLCGGQRQRGLYEGAFASIGRGSTDGLCVSAPFGIPGEEPPRDGPALRGVVPGIGKRDFLILWPGGIWDWTDPLTPIRAVARLSEERTDLKLVFLGRASPAAHEASPEMGRAAVDLARRLGVLGRSVHFLPGWIAYADRGRYLTEADLGVSAHPATLEARFAYRTRVMDCIWARLPVICTQGDETAEKVQESRIGKVVPAGDVDAWVEGMREATTGAGWFRKAPAKMEALRSSITWDLRLAPLVRYLASPRRTSGGWAAWPRYVAGLVGAAGQRLGLFGKDERVATVWTSP